MPEDCRGEPSRSRAGPGVAEYILAMVAVGVGTVLSVMLLVSMGWGSLR